MAVRVFHVEKHTKNCNVEQQALTTIFVSLLFKVHITSKIIFHKKKNKAYFVEQFCDNFFDLVKFLIFHGSSK